MVPFGAIDFGQSNPCVLFRSLFPPHPNLCFHSYLIVMWYIPQLGTALGKREDLLGQLYLCKPSTLVTELVRADVNV